jgi:hypothetical protein
VSGVVARAAIWTLAELLRRASYGNLAKLKRLVASIGILAAFTTIPARAQRKVETVVAHGKILTVDADLPSLRQAAGSHKPSCDRFKSPRCCAVNLL